MQFCVSRSEIPQIFHSLHKITHFLTGYINSYFLYEYRFVNKINCLELRRVVQIYRVTLRRYFNQWRNSTICNDSGNNAIYTCCYFSRKRD
jgi:hypothetical protein